MAFPHKQWRMNLHPDPTGGNRATEMHAPLNGLKISFIRSTTRIAQIRKQGDSHWVMNNDSFQFAEAE
jgi:hypothetical protein